MAGSQFKKELLKIKAVLRLEVEVYKALDNPFLKLFGIRTSVICFRFFCATGFFFKN